MTKQPNPALENLIQCLQSLDKQIAREENTRTPAERETQGVQKWEAFSRRIELLVNEMLDAFSDDQVKLDSIIVLSQATVKALSIAIDELGEEHLGAVRSSYCEQAISQIEYDCRKCRDVFSKETHLN